MRSGEYKLAVQRGSGAAYAWVVLEAHDSLDEAFFVDTTLVDTWWRPAVAFGVNYAHEKCLFAGQRRKVSVTVTSVQTMAVDTNQMAVAFASYQAACIALGMRPDDRVRLRPDWTYEFPA